MRITMMCGGTRVFGTERMALTLARGLMDRGIEVRVVASGWNDGDFLRRLAALDVPAATMRLGKISKSLKPRAVKYTLDALVHLPGALLTLRRHLRAAPPDVVIVYNRDWALQASRLLRRYPVVFHTHEAPAPSQWSRRAYGALSQVVTQWAAASEYVGERLRELGLPRDRVTIVYNGLEHVAGIDSAAMTEAAPKGMPIIGIVGQVGAWKGHDDLMEAIAVLRTRGQRFRCYVVGSGEHDYMESLKRKARALGVEDRITWRGYVEDVSSIYRDLSVVVVPSRFEEPFGLVAVEAGMHGVPVVATRRGGLPEIVVDGDTGFLVDPEQPQQLADRLEQLLGDGSLRRRLGDAGRARALERFTAERMALDMGSLCERVLNKTESRHADGN